MRELSVNPKLYDFLKENECTIFIENNKLVAYVLVYFEKLSEFVEVVGKCHFEEHGIQVGMRADFIAIELKYFFEALNQTIVDYKSIFDISDWYRYYDRLKEEYGEDYPNVFVDTESEEKQ